jgi:hypothetical protein
MIFDFAVVKFNEVLNYMILCREIGMGFVWLFIWKYHQISQRISPYKTIHSKDSYTMTTQQALETPKDLLAAKLISFYLSSKPLNTIQLT